MSVVSLFVEQLEAQGLPLQYASKVAGMFTGDIISLGLRLALIGLFAGLIRGWFNYWKHYIQSTLFPTAHLANKSREWIDSYFAQNPEVQRQLKGYRLRVDRNSEFTATKMKSGKSLPVCTWVGEGFCGSVTPNCGQTVRVTVNGRSLWFTKYTSNYNGDPLSAEMHYRAQYWFWNSELIKSFLAQAFKVHHAKDETELHIYNYSASRNIWIGPTTRGSRAWDSLILPGTVKADLLKDVKEFFSEQESLWYTSKAFPIVEGKSGFTADFWVVLIGRYLLHGPPGAGKTTLATALAGALQLDLYCINPGATQMDDSKLQKGFRTCPPGSLILIEDVDCVMPVARDRGRLSDDSDDGKNGGGSAEKGDSGQSSVTLSGLLNAIDGVSSQEDSVLFASTNHPDQLDSALKRPGRFDVYIAFDYAVHSQAVDLFKHFYPLSWIRHVLPANTDENSIEKSSLYQFEDQDDVDRAAQQFANSIMDKKIKVSIATIQAFLLLYKKDPVIALDKVDEWAEGIRIQQFPDLQEGKQDLQVKGKELDVEKDTIERQVEEAKDEEKGEARKGEVKV